MKYFLVLDLIYVKSARKACKYKDSYNQYERLDLAKSACSSDSNCGFVEHPYCLESYKFKLCKMNSELNGATRSCVYEKLGKT